MGSLTKGLIGKEDLEIQYNANATESFDRIASGGSTLSLSKFPDIWTGLGGINVANVVAGGSTITNAKIVNLTLSNAPAADPGDITETVALGTLTHDVLKAKINDLLAALRAVNIIG